MQRPVSSPERVLVVSASHRQMVGLHDWLVGSFSPQPEFALARPTEAPRVVRAYAPQLVVVCAGERGDAMPGLVRRIRAAAPAACVMTIQGVAQLLDWRSASARVRADAVTRPAGATGVRAALSARELEVLVLLVDGSSNAEAAHRLGLSPKTIATYRSRLMHKLEIRDFATLVKLAIREGLTPLD